jgi:hypothetical protein
MIGIVQSTAGSGIVVEGAPEMRYLHCMRLIHVPEPGDGRKISQTTTDHRGRIHFHGIYHGGAKS